MSTFYHHHSDNATADLPTTGHDHQLHHTFILMNPNFASGYTGPHQPPPPPGPVQSSQNILLLNSAAAANHQFFRPMLPPQQDGITLYGYPHADARETTRPRQGLSLSLSPRRHQHAQYGAPPHDADLEGDVAHPVTGSVYLKAAQELLDEVVNVGHGLLGIKNNSDSNQKQAQAQAQSQAQAQAQKKGTGELSDEKGGGSGEGGGESSVQLSSAERQELQMKKAKLITMLDEAEQKYRQYHSQMQMVIHSFEQTAGVGSSKTYTALALKTISKQFRCLKDAIQGQIKAAGKSLGEGGGSGLSGARNEGCRLKYIDHQIRQQRALQQLGVLQNHNAWRPQRGLPERSVSLLRAWLFEHFLHPYPKDSDKIMLAKQTGLTRSQVSNWFINARVRLWKPMIEEMYSEEIKEQEQNVSEEQKYNSKQNSHESNSTNINIIDENQPNNSLKDQNNTISSPSSSPPSSLQPVPTNSSRPFKGNGFSFSGSSLEMEGISQGSPKRPRNDQIDPHCVAETEFIKFGNDQKQERESNVYSIMNFVGEGEELESYPSLGEMGRFTHEFQPTRFFQGNGISLSLGLPPCENQITATNHTFLSSHNIQFRRNNDFGSMNSPPQHSTPSAFECLDIQNRKGFAAQLLQDFVA